MTVIVGLKRLHKGKIQVSVTRLRQGPQRLQNCSSSQQAARVLNGLGVSQDAIDYYLETLLPHLSERQQLLFPAMDISEGKLSLVGFAAAGDAEIPMARSA